MAESQREALPKFNVKGDPSTVAQRWKHWKRAFELYVKAQAVTDDARQKALLLHCGGMDLQDVFYALEAEDDADTYAQCVKTLEAHFLPQKNIAFKRHLFRQLEQGASETVDQYVCRLREKASTCEFSNVDESIRDQLIDKCRDARLRRKFLEKTGDAATLKSLQETARAFEAVNQQMKQMHLLADSVNHVGENENGESESDVNAVGRKQKFSRNRSQKPKQGSRCYRCGKHGHVASDTGCPALGKDCRKCGKKDHFESCCRSRTVNNKYQKSSGKDRGKKHMSVKMVQNDENSDSSGDIDYAFGIHRSRKHQKLGVSVGNVPLDIIVNSGATVNVIGQNTWEYLKENKIDCVSRKCSDSKIYAYGSPEPLPVIGTFETLVKAGTCEASC